MYLHPLEVAGEVKPETVEIAIDAIEKAARKSGGMFVLKSVRMPYKVYGELTEDEIRNFYSKHENDIRALVSNYFETMLWKQKVDADMYTKIQTMRQNRWRSSKLYFCFFYFSVKIVQF